MNKTALYVMKFPLDRKYALTGKLQGQMNGLRKLGYDVHYLGWDKNYFYLITNESRICIQKVRLSRLPYYFHTKIFFDLCRSALKAIRNYSYDFVYIRSMPLGLMGLRLYRSIHKKKNPLIVEIPTYMKDGEESPSSWLRKVANLYFSAVRKLSAKYVTFFTLIGDEADTYLKRPAINIANGIDVDSCPIRNPIFDPDTIHLVSVSSMAYWHGYDRLIKGLANYKEKDFKVIYHVIGNGVMNEPWEELAKQLGVADKVIFHGAMFGEELYSFLNRCDLGISSLGLYRSGIVNSTTLKSNEYIAIGLPFVYAANDRLLTPDFPYAIKVLNDDSDIEIERLVMFAMQQRQEANVAFDMHSYASLNLSWESQWMKVLTSLEKHEKE